MAIDTGLATVETESDAWAQASLAWLSGLAANTQRTYRAAWTELLAFAQRMPWAISRADVARWVESLRRGGRSAATIRQRLAAISSFYRFVGNDFTAVREGEEQALFAGANPAGARSLRPKRESFQDAHYLGVEACRGLLRAIRCCTGVQAERDYALFLCYLFLGRRNSEVRLLRWGDIEMTDGATWYRWSGKGHTNVRSEMPAICLQAVRGYLQAAGRLAEIGPEEYVFVPLNDHGERLKPTRQSPPAPLHPPEQDAETAKGGRALSSRQVGRLLKKYCALAGLDAERVHVHTLRHSAAMLRKAAGDDIEAIQRFLVHSSLSVTQVYLHQLEGNGDASWGRVADLLGLNDSTVAPGRRNFRPNPPKKPYGGLGRD